MSGQAAFDEPVRLAALCTLGAAGKKESKLCEEKELNGIREERNDTSDEEGDRMEDEGEFAEQDPGTSHRRGREKSMKQHTCRSETGAYTA